MDPQDTERRGRQAEQVKDNPIFLEALDAFRGEIITEWRACQDAAARERLHAEIGAADRLVAIIERVITEAKVAAAQAQLP